MSRKRKANFVPEQDRSFPLDEGSSNATNRHPASGTPTMPDPARGMGNGLSHPRQHADSFQSQPQLMYAQQDQVYLAQIQSALNQLSALLYTSSVDDSITYSHSHTHDNRSPTRHDPSHGQSNAHLPSMQSSLLALLQMLLGHGHQTQVSSSNHGTGLASGLQASIQIPAVSGSPNPANLLGALQLLGMLQSGGQSANPPHPPMSSVTTSHSQDNMQNTSQNQADRGPIRQESGASTVNERPRAPFTLYMSCDDHMLSDYQCLIRMQIELFAAGNEDVCTIGQGRNRRVQVGQVGVRCKHCSHIPQLARTKGAVYFPFRTDNVYQACQNIAAVHLCDNCPNIPASVKAELQRLAKEPKSTAGGGKKYWSEGVRVAGIVEDAEGRLHFGDT